MRMSVSKKLAAIIAVIAAIAAFAAVPGGSGVFTAAPTQSGAPGEFGIQRVSVNPVD
jgi:hypothetical protein